MKHILKITAFAAAASTLLLGGCIKEAIPTDVATEDQVTLETQLRGIPAALVQAGSTGYAQQGAAWDFSLPAIHLATESMTGDLVVTGNIGYDWFQQWGTNDALGSDYAVCALTWNNYYTWIMMANNVISLIDASDLAALDATERSYLGFAYAYRAMFYFDLVRLYEFKENTVTSADELLGLGVPIVLPETTEAQAKNNPRATVDEIYDRIIFPDLEMAEDLLETYTAADKYTISLPLIYGLPRARHREGRQGGLFESRRVCPQGHHGQRLHAPNAGPVGGSDQRIQQRQLEQRLDLGPGPAERECLEPLLLHGAHELRERLGALPRRPRHQPQPLQQHQHE